MQGTDFARPVEGAAWHNLPDSSLFPGESSFVEVEFEATDANTPTALSVSLDNSMDHSPMKLAAYRENQYLGQFTRKQIHAVNK